MCNHARYVQLPPKEEKKIVIIIQAVIRYAFEHCVCGRKAMWTASKLVTTVETKKNYKSDLNRMEKKSLDAMEIYRKWSIRIPQMWSAKNQKWDTQIESIAWITISTIASCNYVNDGKFDILSGSSLYCSIWK